MNSEEEEGHSLTPLYPATLNPLTTPKSPHPTPPTNPPPPIPSAQAPVHQQKPLYSQQCCFYSCYIYPQSCPSGAAGTADLKQSLTLMTGGQSRNSGMLTSTVIWPAERAGEREMEGKEREREREIHSLMTTTNTDVPLFQLYKTAHFSGIALASMGLIKLVLFRLQTWPPKRDRERARCVSLANSCQHDSVKLLISDINNASRQMRLTLVEYESLA